MDSELVFPPISPPLFFFSLFIYLNTWEQRHDKTICGISSLFQPIHICCLLLKLQVETLHPFAVVVALSFLNWGQRSRILWKFQQNMTLSNVVTQNSHLTQHAGACNSHTDINLWHQKGAIVSSRLNFAATLLRNWRVLFFFLDFDPFSRLSALLPSLHFWPPPLPPTSPTPTSSVSCYWLAAHSFIRILPLTLLDAAWGQRACSRSSWGGRHSGSMSTPPHTSLLADFAPAYLLLPDGLKCTSRMFPSRLAVTAIRQRQSWSQGRRYIKE